MFEVHFTHSIQHWFVQDVQDMHYMSQKHFCLHLELHTATNGLFLRVSVSVCVCVCVSVCVSVSWVTCPGMGCGYGYGYGYGYVYIYSLWKSRQV